jgi:hypothetical protein
MYNPKLKKLHVWTKRYVVFLKYEPNTLRVTEAALSISQKSNFQKVSRRGVSNTALIIVKSNKFNIRLTIEKKTLLVQQAKLIPVSLEKSKQRSKRAQRCVMPYGEEEEEEEREEEGPDENSATESNSDDGLWQSTSPRSFTSGFTPPPYDSTVTIHTPMVKRLKQTSTAKSTPNDPAARGGEESALASDDTDSGGEESDGYNFNTQTQTYGDDNNVDELQSPSHDDNDNTSTAGLGEKVPTYLQDFYDPFAYRHKTPLTVHKFRKNIEIAHNRYLKKIARRAERARIEAGDIHADLVDKLLLEEVDEMYEEHLHIYELSPKHDVDVAKFVFGLQDNLIEYFDEVNHRLSKFDLHNYAKDVMQPFHYTAKAIRKYVDHIYKATEPAILKMKASSNMHEQLKTKYNMKAAVSPVDLVLTTPTLFK